MIDVEESCEMTANCDEQSQRLWHQNYYTSCNIVVDEQSAGFPLQDEDGDGVFGKKRKADFDPNPICVEEEEESSDHHMKQRKRTRSAELHNHNERLRRQRLKEKIKALQDLIPNCNKRDKSSTFDDAIKYIKTLQNQLQVMSMGAAGYSTLNSPHSPSIGMGMRMPPMFPSNQYLFPSPTMPFDFTTNDSLRSKSAATSSSSHHPIISEQSSTRRESITRVLPTKIVHSKEVMDYGSSHSESTEERSSSSTAKWKDPLFL